MRDLLRYFLKKRNAGIIQIWDYSKKIIQRIGIAKINTDFKKVLFDKFLKLSFANYIELYYFSIRFQSFSNNFLINFLWLNFPNRLFSGFPPWQLFL
jgi:hypothetical protein